MSSEANNDAANSPATGVLTGDAPPGDATLPTEAPPPEPAIVATATPAEQSAEPEANVPESAPDDEAAWSPGSLSEHDADHFANDLRPSWDLGADASAESWAAAAAPVSHAPSSTHRSSSPPGYSDSIPPLAMSRGLDRRTLAAGGSVLVVIVLAIWSMTGGEPEAPPSWNKDGAAGAGQATATPTPVQAAPVPTTDEATPTPVAKPAPTPPDPPAAIPVPPVAAAVTPPAPARAPPPTPEPARSIHLRISTSPTGADIKLDGNAVPNPFDAWVARTGSHSIVVNADGFVERQWDVNFDQDRTLALALKRAAVKRAAAHRAPHVAARVAPPRPVAPTRNRPRGAGFVTDNPY